jgi:hypothetical protein
MSCRPQFVLTWNGRGFSPSGAWPVLLRILEEHRPDYVCLSETWALPSPFPTVPQYRVFSPPPCPSARGVAILVHQSTPARLTHTINLPGGEACLVTVPGGQLISVYAPPRASAAEFTAFLQTLQAIPGALVVAGDWNARHPSWDSGTNKRRCSRGVRLHEARRFMAHAPLQPTFEGSRGASTVDLVLVSRPATVPTPPHTLVVRGNTQSDHHPVWAPIRWEAPEPHSLRIRPSVLHAPARHEAAAAYYADQLPPLADALEAVTTTTDLDRWYDGLCRTLREPFHNGRKPHRARADWSPDLDYLSKMRRSLYRGSRRSPALLPSYRALDRYIQRAVRRRKRQRLQQLVLDLPNVSDPRRQSAIQRALGLSPTRQPVPLAVRQAFTDVVSDPPSASPPTIQMSHFEYPPWMTGHLKQSIDRVPLGKAAGPDGIYGEMVRLAAPWLRSLLPDLWRCCGQLASVPTLWRTVLLEPIYKKGPLLDPQSYRPIGLLSVLRRVVDSALDTQLRGQITHHPAQFGFRRNLGVEQALLRLQRAYAEGPTLTVLLDLRRAYDSVPRAVLLDLVSTRTDAPMAAMIGVLLAPTISQTAGDPTQNTGLISRGVTQGDPKAPTLFNLFMDTLLHRLDPLRETDGVIAFADDVTLFASSALELQRRLHIAETWATHYCMDWAPHKSLVISRVDPQLTLYNAPLPCAGQGRCLGISLSADGLSDSLSVQRLHNAAQRAAQWRGVLRLNRHSPNYTWRRAMLLKFLRPIGEFCLHLVPMTMVLKHAMMAYEVSAMSFMLGHRLPGRIRPAVVATIFRLPTVETRRVHLAHSLLRRINAEITTASTNKSVSHQQLQECATRELDAKANLTLWDSFKVEWLAPRNLRAWWIENLAVVNQGRARHIPLPTTIVGSAAYLLPPALRNTERNITAFLSMQYYLGSFPRGLTAARWRLGTQLAETTFEALRTLLSKNQLSADEETMLKQILLILLASEPTELQNLVHHVSGTTSRRYPCPDR